MNIHEGPGVLPGRYAGPAIPIHRGPTPQQVQEVEERAGADALAGRICAAAAMAARSQCQLLDLIGEFDATDALRWWTDIASVAHWLSWTCSMTPGVAREHVRVAKALRQMPTVRDAFAHGRLSYSKVREVTRVVGLVDETKLCELALTATAAQLSTMISSYRSCAGARLDQQQKRAVTWRTRDDGMVELRALLPADEGAILLAAVGAAKDQYGQPPTQTPTPVATIPGTDREIDEQQIGEQQVDTTPVYTNADALLDVARGFLATAPEDRSGEDRTLVVIHVSADTLAANVPAGTFNHAQEAVAVSTPIGGDARRNVPAGTSNHAQEASATSTPIGGDARRNVPAGTSDTSKEDLAAATPIDGGVPRNVPAGTSTATADGSSGTPSDGGSSGDVPAGTCHIPEEDVPAQDNDPTCHIQGVGPLEPETARRYTCDADLLGAVINQHGDILALGRTQRFVTRTQRRALIIRDRLCRFPGCAQTRHLKAHHIIAWSHGGPTDLNNLILLCQHHHTAVHEGGMRIERGTAPGITWRFLMPDGTPHQPWYTAEALPQLLHTQLQQQSATDQASLQHHQLPPPRRPHHPTPLDRRTLQPPRLRRSPLPHHHPRNPSRRRLSRSTGFLAPPVEHVTLDFGGQVRRGDRLPHWESGGDQRGWVSW